MQDFSSRFTSEDGYPGIDFAFSYTTNTGNILCNDQGPFPVYDGLCMLYPVWGERAEWLLDAWKNATSSLHGIGLYHDLNTEIESGKNFSCLSGFYCPICLSRKSVFEGHHCIPRSEGGRDGFQNVLKICSSCHAQITWGCFEERWAKENAALFHQVMYFDFDVYRINYAKIRISPSDPNYRFVMRFRSSLSFFDKTPEDYQPKRREIERKLGRYLYQYYRDISLGIRDWKRELNLFPEILRNFKKDYPWMDLHN